MTFKYFSETLVVIGLIVFGGWALYDTIFPSRHYNPGDKLYDLPIIVKEPPYFHFTGMDNPSYYVLTSQKYTNSFRMSDEVRDLVQDSESISNAIKNIKRGDTLLIYLNSESKRKLNKSAEAIDILGLTHNKKIIFGADALDKYYRESRSNNRFSIFVILLIFYFIYRKAIISKIAAK